MSAPILELRNVHKSFGGKQVLRGVDLSVARGRSLAIIGGSGVGKSVTIKCALGLIAPDQGEVFFDGHAAGDAKSIDALRRRTGMLFQGGALFDSLTVWENVAFALMYRDHISRAEARKRAIETLAKVRLGASAADLRPAELSGGMQKRVALARAIIARPDLIFFDEPTTGLDPITADAVNNLIVEQVKALGAAAVSITHDMASTTPTPTANVTSGKRKPAPPSNSRPQSRCANTAGAPRLSYLYVGSQTLRFMAPRSSTKGTT
jgi:phospholipid/cholesterol/gamma-HCH transport system ATP-binding protein